MLGYKAAKEYSSISAQAISISTVHACGITVLVVRDQNVAVLAEFNSAYQIHVD